MHKSANDALADAWNATFDRQQAEINRLRTEGALLRRKVEHLAKDRCLECVDAYCDDCDPVSGILEKTNV